MSEQEVKLNRPEAVRYLDYRLYLRDMALYLADQNKKYSLRWIAKRAGFNSPQLLPMILNGQRNLARDKVKDLSEALKLDSYEQEYLDVLLELSLAQTHDAQSAILTRIKTSFQSGNFTNISQEGEEIFREWYVPAIRELVVTKGAPSVAMDYPAWIAGRLDITVEQASEAIDMLVTRGFLNWNEGRLERTTPSVRTDKKKSYPLYLAAHHMRMCERAFSAVRLPRDQRYYQTMTFPIKRQRLEELRERISRFIREFDDWVEVDSKDSDDVMQFHLSVFPLSNRRSS